MQPTNLFAAVLAIALTVFLWPAGGGAAAADETDTLRIGGDYSYLKVPSERDENWCKAACEQDVRCRAWTFIKARRQCRLKRTEGEARGSNCCVSGVRERPRTASRRLACADYANKAIEHMDENRQKSCGYIGEGWSGDFKLHFRTCMLMKPLQQRAAVGGRERALRQCDDKKEELNSQCRKFAADAISIAGAVARNNCTVNDEPWIHGYDEALKWCEDNSSKANEDAFKKVRDELASCLAYGGGPYLKRCDTYARDAIEQYIKARGNECGFRGDDWSADYKTHYQFCLKLGAWDTRNAIQERDMAIDRCIERAGKSREGKIACDHYARLASEQTRTNRKHKCGLRGRRWLADFDRHFAWCKTTSKRNRDLELKYREGALNKCFERGGGEFNELCDTYAARAVRQFNQNLENNCNYRGEDWHNSYQRHYAYCLKAQPGETGIRRKRRERLLKTCGKGFKLPFSSFN